MKSFSHNVSASLLLASVFYAVAACSSGESSGAGGRDAFIAQYCDIYSPCCAKVGKPTDGAACRAFIGAFTAGAQYNATAGNKCLEETRALAAAPTFCDEGASGPSCDQALGSGSTGTAKPGENCSDDEDCAPSTEGEVSCASAFGSGGATTKKCQVQLVGKVGDTPCVGTVDGNFTSFSSGSDVPPKGYLCNVKDGIRCDDTTKACKAISKVGEACETFGSNQCTKDAYCDRTAKLCVARKAVGQACEGFADDQCVSTAYCDSTTKLCVALIADGAACTTSSACASKSCVNSKCEPGSTGATFLCGGD